MKRLVAIVCFACLTVPALAVAAQPEDVESVVGLLMHETVAADTLHAFMKDMLSGEGVTKQQTEGMHTQSSVLTYVCYYIAFRAIVDFIDCLIYYDISYDCRSAIINGLIFYYLC